MAGRRKSSQRNNASQDLFNNSEENSDEEIYLDAKLIGEDNVELTDGPRPLKRNHQAPLSAELAPTRKRLRLNDEESQLVGMSSQLSIASPSPKLNSKWTFASNEEKRDDDSIYRNCNSPVSSSDESLINRSTVSESEVDGRSRTRKVASSRHRKQSQQLVCSDSEPESPSLRIRKSPRCQIYPRKTNSSAVSFMDAPSTSTSRRVRGQIRSPEARQMPDQSVICVSDDENDYSPNPVAVIQQIEDDEQMAKRLQAEFDAEVNGAPANEHIAPPPHRPNRASTSQTRIPRTVSSRSRSSLRIPSMDQIPNASVRFASHWDVLDNIDLSEIWTTMRMSTPPQVMGSDGRLHAANYLPDGVVTNRRTTRNADMALRMTLPVLENSYETLIGLADNIGDVNRGLSEDEIGQLPTRKINEVPCSSGPSGKETECQICMCNYAIGDEIRSLTCFHEFHKMCIDRWLKLNATCPICRVELDFNQN